MKKREEYATVMLEKDSRIYRGNDELKAV